MSGDFTTNSFYIKTKLISACGEIGETVHLEQHGEKIESYVIEAKISEISQCFRNIEIYFFFIKAWIMHTHSPRKCQFI